MHLASVDVCDQLGYGLSYSNSIVQCRQWIGRLSWAEPLTPSANSAELRGFVRIGVKEADSALIAAARQRFPFLAFALHCESNFGRAILYLQAELSA